MMTRPLEYVQIKACQARLSRFSHKNVRQFLFAEVCIQAGPWPDSCI